MNTDGWMDDRITEASDCLLLAVAAKKNISFTTDKQLSQSTYKIT